LVELVGRGSAASAGLAELVRPELQPFWWIGCIEAGLMEHKSFSVDGKDLVTDLVIRHE